MSDHTSPDTACAMNKEKVVEAYYDDWTDRYLESFGDVFQAARAKDDDELVAHYVKMAGIEDGMHILDAGCGVCGPSIRIAKMRDVRIDALTISTVQANHARQRVRDAGLDDRITIHQGDFTNLRSIFETERFDRIYFLESLCHGYELDKIAKGALAVLKQQGCLYVKDFYRRPYEGLKRSWSDVVISRVEKVFCLRVRDIAEVNEAMMEEGFELEQYRKLSFDYNFEMAERFAQTNRIDVFEGGEPIDWGDWYECLFKKP